MRAQFRMKEKEKDPGDITQWIPLIFALVQLEEMKLAKQNSQTQWFISAAFYLARCTIHTLHTCDIFESGHGYLKLTVICGGQQGLCQQRCSQTCISVYVTFALLSHFLYFTSHPFYMLPRHLPPILPTWPGKEWSGLQGEREEGRGAIVGTLLQFCMFIGEEAD